MCTDLFAPLARAPNVSVGVIPAFALLRSAERHLGRWLLLAEVGARAGDCSALGEARERAQSGAASARAAWTLVAWALEDADAVNHLRSRPTAPSVRLTLELIARLSDSPECATGHILLVSHRKRLASTCGSDARGVCAHAAPR